MQKRVLWRRTATSLLLLFAMLFVGIAVFLPTVVSAEFTDHFEDFEDFSFQTRSNATQNSSSTDLRFAYSIGALYYDEVGFVFSTSNSNPNVNNGTKYRATNVYSSITTENGTIPARSGRYWVAVKLSGIPKNKFEQRIYIRPYLKYDGIYYYGDTKGITVLEALTYDKTVAGESNVFDSKSPSGSYYSEGTFIVSKSASQIRGNKHFYPTTAEPNGNDVWFEYSFLWNPTFENWTGLAEMEVASIWQGDGVYNHHRALYYNYMRDNVKSYCPFGGHFDYTTELPNVGSACFINPGNGQPIYLGDFANPITEADSPSFGEYGWHRIGVHFHQEAAASGGNVVYTGIHELYLDGVKVWVTRTNMQGNNGKSLKDKGVLLWTARTTAASGYEQGPGGLYYKENNVYIKLFMDYSLTSAPKSVFVAVADVHWTCGNGFVRQVSPVSNPIERKITLGGTTCSAKIWYVFDN